MSVLPDLLADHLADLCKSGLTYETIAALKVYSAPPFRLKALPPEWQAQVKSALGMPYYRIDGGNNCAERFKLFPPAKDANGGTVKYWQPQGTDPHLYLPPLLDWLPLAADPSKPLRISEGEKKAAALTQHSIPCLGVAGVWNWRARLDSGERLTLPEWDLFTWKGREVELVPDSDAWREGKLQKICAGFYALAMELVSRGANVRFVRLSETDGIKVGIDDWIAAKGEPWWRHEWPVLERLPLESPIFKPLAYWWQGWRAKQVEQQAAKSRDAAQPDVQVVGGIVQLDWPAYRVRMLFERVKEMHGGLKADLTVNLTTHTEVIPLLSSVSVNLSSLEARNKCAKMLRERHNDVPWQTLMETGFARVLVVTREGEPLEHISPAAQVEPLTFRVNPLIYDGKITVVYGDGGLGKSSLALLCGLLVESGSKVGSLIGVQGRALYLDWEDDLPVHLLRAKKLWMAHPALAQADVLYQRCASPLSDMAAQLHRIVAQHNVKLIIVDSLAMACGSDPQAPEAAIRVFRVLRQLRCAALIIAHVPKTGGGSDGETKEASIYGSVFHKNLARSTWEIKKVQEAGDHKLRLGLFNKKYNLDAGSRPIGFLVQFFPEKTVYEPFDVAEEPTLAKGLSVRERLKRALNSGERKDASALAEEVGCSEKEANARLYELRKAGWCEKYGQLWAKI